MKIKGQKIIIVLGGSNEVDGSLSAITLSRLDCCLENYQNGDLILCTGGWGPRFNQGPESHAHYTREYLIRKGIPKTVFIELVASANTVEDAVMSKNVIEKLKNIPLQVITSDFHIKRAQIIFDQVMENREIDYIAAPSNLSKEEARFRIHHEKRAIDWIQKNGLQY